MILRDMLNDSKKIIKTLIGDVPPKETAIITPLTEIYLEINSCFRVKDESDLGWWKSKICNVEEGLEVLVTKVPQGPPLIDYVIALNDRVKNLFLLGFCGGINQDLNIGDIVLSTEAFYEGNFEKSIFATNFVSSKISAKNVVSGRTGTSLSFLSEDFNFLRDMRKIGIIALDMETYFMYKFCNLYDINAASLMIVSDVLGKKRFFELNRDDKHAIKSGIKKTINMVGMVINSES